MATATKPPFSWEAMALVCVIVLMLIMNIVQTSIGIHFYNEGSLEDDESLDNSYIFMIVTLVVTLVLVLSGSVSAYMSLTKKPPAAAPVKP